MKLKYEAGETCFLCEKELKCAGDTHIELSWGDNSIDLEPESGAIPETESQGCFPVGSTCIKKLQKIAKELKTNHIPSDEYEHLMQRK